MSGLLSLADSPSCSLPSGFRETRLIDFDVTIFDPVGEHTATVFWLHGLGDTGRGMIPGVIGLRMHLSKEFGEGVKFVLPHAPKMKVTGNLGEAMPSWFDCYSFDIENREEDEEGIADAADWLNDFVDLELETCPYLTPARIVIGGLSQGGAVTCRTIVATERTLGGAFLLSTYVPLRKKVPELKTPLSSTIPIFWGHGTLDAQVSFALALRSAKQLSADLGTEFVQLGLVPLQPKDVKDDSPHHSTNHQGIKLRFTYYGTLGHWFCDEELQDLAVWLSAILGEKEEGKKGWGKGEGGESEDAGGSGDDDQGQNALTGPGGDGDDAGVGVDADTDGAAE